MLPAEAPLGRPDGDAAGPLIDGVLKVDPDHDAARLAQADLLAARGDVDSALPLYLDLLDFAAIDTALERRQARLPNEDLGPVIGSRL